MIPGADTFQRDSAQLAELRAAHYNATIQAIVPIHDDLRILRVVPDDGLPDFVAGQFVTLGLGNWEKRVAGVDEEHLSGALERRLAKRAYSLSCSLLDDRGDLKRASEFPYWEFYVALVRHAQKHPPALTPRLFALAANDRLFVERQAKGNYTLQGVPDDSDVYFFATGTGEAPHNAMIAELLTRGHRGRIVSVLSVRYWRDAAYRLVHEELVRRHANYRYVLLVTRESIDRAVAGACYAGCHRLQKIVESGALETLSGAPLAPTRAHVFLCGSPAMIGAQPLGQSHPTYPPGSMLDILQRRGFQVDQAGQTGNIHFERYW